MTRRGKRHSIARNIYEDATGRAAVARLGDWRKEKRYPPHTPLEVMNGWIAGQIERWGGKRRQSPRGTLEGDAERYLDLVRHLSGWVSLKAELAAWVRLYGDFPRYTLTTDDVYEARNVWLAEGLSPKTVNMRVGSLNRLWHTLDGRRAISPGDDIQPLEIHKAPPQAINPSIVLAVYHELAAWESTGRLRDAKARARFMVVASTGKRPSEVMRAEPGDVDMERRVWNVRDGKGGWSPGVYLNDDMLSAWEVFIEAEAWGTFREGSWVKTLRAAGWPDGVRPYQMRHSVGIAMSDEGIDLADISQHMGHKKIETTRKHYVPVLGSRLQKASEAIDHRFGWRPKRKVARKVARSVKSRG